MLVGFLGTGIPSFMYAIAITRIPSATAGILNSMTPIWTLLIGLAFYATVFKRSQLVGVLLGLIGAIALIVFDSESLRLTFDVFALLILVGTLCYGFSGNIVQRYCQDMNPLVLTAFSFFAIGGFALIILLTSDFIQVMQTHPEAWWSFTAVAVLSIFGTVMANVLFYRLIQNTNAVFASSVSYLIPVTAIIWGLVDAEVLTWLHYSGMILILLGIYQLRK